MASGNAEKGHDGSVIALSPPLPTDVSPETTGTQQPLCQFTDSAMTARVEEDAIGSSAQRQGCIRGRNKQCDMALQSQVIEIIPNEQDLLGCQAHLQAHGPQRLRFVTGADATVTDVELAGAHLRRPSPSAAEEGHLNAGALQKADAKAVAHMEALEEFPLRAMPEAAVGENAINVEDNRLDQGETS